MKLSAPTKGTIMKKDVRGWTAKGCGCLEGWIGNGHPE